MTWNFANRLLTLGETWVLARRYDVGMTSVLRRYLVGEIDRLTRRAGDAGLKPGLRVV
ncbi:hypothetical protein N9L47_03540 [Rhodobacteraceae bacterium]|nr:hypothetical protein [Paracoccaceae bacterium]